MSTPSLSPPSLSGTLTSSSLEIRSVAAGLDFSKKKLQYYIIIYFSIQKEKSVGSATPRPVFQPNVLEIAEEIKKINEIEAKKIESTEEILAEVESEFEAEEVINEIADVLAEEIAAEELATEIKEITNVAAAEMVAEEIIQDIANLEEELTKDIDISDNEIYEGSGFANIDFGAITEVTI